jgi:cell division protein FtsL
MRQENFSLLEHESRNEFNQLSDHWKDQFENERDRHPALEPLIKDVIEREWMQRRCMNHVNALQNDLFRAEVSQNRGEIEYVEKRLLNAMRYKTAAENSFARAVRILEQFVRARVREDNEQRRLAIQEYAVTEHALVQRVKHDIPTHYEMRLSDHDEKAIDDDDDDLDETEEREEDAEE